MAPDWSAELRFGMKQWEKHPTSNIESSAPDRLKTFDVQRSMLDVRCFLRNPTSFISSLLEGPPGG
jgi:hypothetical protein